MDKMNRNTGILARRLHLGNREKPTAMKFKISVFTHNPTRETVISPTSPSEKNLFLLCHGLRSMVAADTVCQTIMEKIGDMSDGNCATLTDLRLDEALIDAYDALDRLPRLPHQQAGTTLTLCKLHARGCTLANIGTSRGLHIRPATATAESRILYETRNHCYLNDPIDPHGDHPYAGMLAGSHLRYDPDVYHREDLRAGDCIVLMTANLRQRLSLAKIRQLFSCEGGSTPGKVRWIKHLSNQVRGRAAFILIHIERVEENQMEQQRHRHPMPRAWVWAIGITLLLILGLFLI